MRESSPVSSHDEWTRLEEVIVGRAVGARHRVWDEIDRAYLTPDKYPLAHALQGKPFPADHIERATLQLEAFVELLHSEGVVVRRPEPIDFGEAYGTPDWQWPSGFNCANPRDLVLVIGDRIIEAPTPRRGRRFEAQCYRHLFRQYGRQGARWCAAPAPLIGPDLFVPGFEPNKEGEPVRFPITDSEPVFDAADFMRCGRDIIGQKSFLTNEPGIDWLQNHLGPDYRLHLVESKCTVPYHIDTTFVPLAPGKAIINPDYVARLPPILDGWDVRPAPRPVPVAEPSPFSFCSDWLSMNMLSLDEKHVFVEQQQIPTIEFLRDWGFVPIPIAFDNVYPFGGAIHCATLDIRRSGALADYF